mmetsp:Transcript_35425/g.89477  ORF Transcript_35425/g.89477 Transcript_35425/m.89477 type:complete len:355 (+) Transcript_35425:1008-2072(+)
MRRPRGLAGLWWVPSRTAVVGQCNLVSTGGEGGSVAWPALLASDPVCANSVSNCPTVPVSSEHASLEAVKTTPCCLSAARTPRATVTRTVEEEAGRAAAPRLFLIAASTLAWWVTVGLAGGRVGVCLAVARAVATWLATCVLRELDAAASDLSNAVRRAVWPLPSPVFLPPSLPQPFLSGQLRLLWLPPHVQHPLSLAPSLLPSLGSFFPPSLAPDGGLVHSDVACLPNVLWFAHQSWRIPSKSNRNPLAMSTSRCFLRSSVESLDHASSVVVRATLPPLCGVREGAPITRSRVAKASRNSSGFQWSLPGLASGSRTSLTSVPTSVFATRLRWRDVETAVASWVSSTARPTREQ